MQASVVACLDFRKIFSFSSGSFSGPGIIFLCTSKSPFSLLKTNKSATWKGEYA